MNGLEIFRERLGPFHDHFVLIGGTALHLAFEAQGLAPPRTTKDLDIVLIAERLPPAFARALWSFIREGGYEISCTGASLAPNLYRFQKPKRQGFPWMLELFSRPPSALSLPEGVQATRLSFEEEVSSLSALLLDEPYYRFILDRRTQRGGLSWLTEESLIPLKALAWLNLSRARKEGRGVDTKVINKHRADVLRISGLLNPQLQVDLPSPMAQDLKRFLEAMKVDPPDLKSLNLKGPLPEILQRIADAYGLTLD